MTAPLLHASISGSLADFATRVIGDLGVAGIFVAMLLDCACIPVPSEVTMLFAGFGASRGLYSLPEIIAAGTLGNLVGSWISYGVGTAGRDLVARQGAARGPALAQRLSHGGALERADAFFARYGPVSVLFGRLVPLVRTFISLPAGVARMRFGAFTVFTLIGCLLWAAAFAVIGDAVGRNWTQWKSAFTYVDYAVVAILAGLVALWVLRRARSRRAR